MVKDNLLLLVILVDGRMKMWVKGSGLPGSHVQGHLLMSFRIQGIQLRGDGKDCAPLPPKEWWREVGEPRNLIPRLGVG